MKRVLVLMTVLLSFSTYANDCEFPAPSTESVYDYLSRIAATLVQIKVPTETYSNLPKKIGENATNYLVVSKEVKSSYTCAASIIAASKVSKNKTIAESADSLSQAYQLLSEEADTSIKDAIAMLDGKLSSSLGQQAERNSERVLRFKKIWVQVNKAIVLGTTAVEERVDPKTNKFRSFFISKDERDLIVKALKTQFKFPMKVEKYPIDEMANNYYKFLMELKFK